MACTRYAVPSSFALACTCTAAATRCTGACAANAVPGRCWGKGPNCRCLVASLWVPERQSRCLRCPPSPRYKCHLACSRGDIGSSSCCLPGCVRGHQFGCQQVGDRPLITACRRCEPVVAADGCLHCLLLLLCLLYVGTPHSSRGAGAERRGWVDAHATAVEQVLWQQRACGNADQSVQVTCKWHCMLQPVVRMTSAMPYDMCMSASVYVAMVGIRPLWHSRQYHP